MEEEKKLGSSDEEVEDNFPIQHVHPNQPSNEQASEIVKQVRVDTSNQPVKELIKYGVMGSENIPVDKDAEYLEFSSLRIGELKCLEGCTKTKVLDI
jgi:BRCT domain type II-containing protein